MGPFLKSAKPAYHLEGCTSREEDVTGNWPANEDGMNDKWSPQSD